MSVHGGWFVVSAVERWKTFGGGWERVMRLQINLVISKILVPDDEYEFNLTLSCIGLSYCIIEKMNNIQKLAQIWS